MTEDFFACFGTLEVVFPLGEEGLRESPAQCMACARKTECLRTALDSKEGLGLVEERIDQAYATGRMSFLQRWASRKGLERKREEK